MLILENIRQDLFWAKVNKTENCWLWSAGTNPQGYGIFSVNHYPYKAHRLSWMLYHHKLITQDIKVLHICDNPLCVNPDHLFSGTIADNVHDMIRKGRARFGINTPRGELNVLAKVTEQDVINIRQEYAAGMYSQRELARKYKIGHTTVRHILHRRTWKHI